MRLIILQANITSGITSFVLFTANFTQISLEITRAAVFILSSSVLQYP